MNIKIVVAPVLAIALALFLAGAISYLPVTPTVSDQNQGLQTSNGIGSFGGTSPLPQAAPSMANVTSLGFFIAGAVIISIFAVVLLFREKA